MAKKDFLSQAFGDEPFGFAYDEHGNLIPADQAPPRKIRLPDGRVLTVAEYDKEFPEEPEQEEGPKRGSNTKR